MTNAGRRRQPGYQGTRRISREILAILLVPQTAAATPGGCFRLWPAIFIFFSLGSSLRLTLFASSGVFVIYIFSLFFPARFFQVLTTSPAGGGHDRLFLLVIFFHFSFIFYFRFTFFIFCSLFDCFLSFLYFIECVCRTRRTYYDGMALHCPLLRLLHTYVATWDICGVAL